MGITARGAWESVKRHFRALGHNTQTAPFTVAGIGDMSGDVFGNGMLLSKHIRLLAAFDHRHIFLDPAPDTARSFAERERLFSRYKRHIQGKDQCPELDALFPGAAARLFETIDELEREIMERAQNSGRAGQPAARGTASVADANARALAEARQLREGAT